MKFECFLDIMEQKGYIETQKEDINTFIVTKTEKTRDTIETLIDKDDSLFLLWSDYWLLRNNEGHMYNRVYDIKKMIKLIENIDNKKDEEFYISRLSGFGEYIEYINRYFKTNNLPYILNQSGYVTNTKTKKENNDKKQKEEENIDNFIDCLMSD